MNTRKNRAKRPKKESYEDDDEPAGDSSCDDQDEVRKSRIRDCNKEFARRMTILTTWSDYWRDYQMRDGEAYPMVKAKEIMKRSKKITCPIESCGRAFTSIGGLKYHYARCNIEKSFRCIVCDPPEQVNTRGELLRHLILNHYKDLPPLNDDQRQIANSYLSCESRVEKTRKDKKISADTEHSISAQKLIKAFFDIQTRVFSSELFSNRPFRDWFCNDWEPITHEIQRMHYYPPESDSLKFKLSSSESWSSLKVGDSARLCNDKRGQTTGVIFFTGGINTASAWLPKSPNQIDDFKRELIAVAVNCCSLDQSSTYRESQDGEGCIQIWTVSEFTILESLETKISGGYHPKFCTLDYMIAHEYGTIFEMLWCPLGSSYTPESKVGLSRAGLLAVACGDGQIRILSIPHSKQLVATVCSALPSSTNTIEAVPIFKTKPVAILLPPGAGSSTCQQAMACKSICWNLEDNQKLIVAGYANGNVAIFDLENSSPIIYANNEGRHVYRPLRSWIAHGAPVTGVAISGRTLKDILVATGSIDRQLKIWTPYDLGNCLTSDKAPITRILWDFRFRGVISATDAAFTSFHNRVSYRYPVVEGNHNVTVSTHRSTVWGLDNSKVTNAIATSDGAGEVFILPQLVNRSALKRDRNILSTHRFYSMVPRSLEDQCITQVTPQDSSSNNHPPETNGVAIEEQCKKELDQTGGDVPEQVAKRNEDEDGLEPEADFSRIERPVANKPTKFLLPIEHRPVETYSDFKINYGLEFIHYNSASSKTDSPYQPESCIRANDIKDIYCDRPCDYPFSSINALSWSPNMETFQYLISSSHVGLCRIDKVQIVEQIYKGHVDSLMISKKSRS